MIRPSIFFPVNHKGGVGKSTALAIVVAYLKYLNLPLIVASADTNETLSMLLKKPIPQLNMSAEGTLQETLALICQEALETASTVVLDLPARGALSLSIDNITRSGLLDAYDTIGVLPLLADPGAFEGALTFLEEYQPKRLLVFARISKTLPRPETFSEWKLITTAVPNTQVIYVPEITAQQYTLWSQNSAPLHELEETFDPPPR